MFTPAASSDGLRQALSVVRAEAATPEQAAEQLMNFAQTSVYASYFPGSPQTQSFAPFRYRAYSNGVLLGVVVTAGMGYTMNGVYVMGGPFGPSPVYVGLLTDFITPTDPNPTPGGTGNGCFDLSLAETAGTRTVVDYRQTAAGQTSNMTIDTLIVGPKTFEGHAATEVLTKTTMAIAGQPQTNEIHSYEKRTGNAQITHYGSEYSNTTTVPGVSTTTIASKSVATPPWTSGFYALAAGQSETVTMTETTNSTSTITFTIPGVPPITQTNTTTDTTTVTTKFVGRESVTVPAGTYSACKYETNVAGVLGTAWYIDGKGLMVKSTGSAEGVAWTQEATSVKLNGQSL
jgi:hypothetical protein